MLNKYRDNTFTLTVYCVCRDNKIYVSTDNNDLFCANLENDVVKETFCEGAYDTIKEFCRKLNTSNMPKVCSFNINITTDVCIDCTYDKEFDIIVKNENVEIENVVQISDDEFNELFESYTFETV